MEEYIITGLTKYAYSDLSEDDIESLESMIGCVVTESENRSIADGGRMFEMPDGEDTHVDYLELEIIEPELKF